MFSVEVLFTFITISALLCFSPGPDNILVLSQSISKGRKAGVYITVGLCIGLLIHTSLVVLGVLALIKANPIAVEIIRIFGVCYLLYLAWGAFEAKVTDFNMQEQCLKEVNKLIKKGLMMNLLNPKVIIFFLAFLPQFTNTSEGALPIPTQLLCLGLGFIVIAFFSFSLIAYLSSFLRTTISSKPIIQKVLNKTTSLVFITLAINLLISKL